MSNRLHHIRMVAGIEIRPPAPSASFMLEHEQALRLSEPLAEDLAACIPQAMEAHLCLSGSLLESGQILSPDKAPWSAMIEIGRLNQRLEPGVTAIGAHHGRPARPELAPFNAMPNGLFICLPLLLSIEQSRAQALETTLEQTLFDQGGLKPPSLGTLFDLSGVEPVHGQLMTLVDLMALTKMQLAAAGLDAFWTPVEHALLQPDQDFAAEMPGGLEVKWDVEKQYSIDFKTLDQSSMSIQDYTLWLRAFRQTTALLDTHWINWHCTTAAPNCEIESHGRWLQETIPTDKSDPGQVWIHELAGPGLVAYSLIEQGVLKHLYPLKNDAVGFLQRRFTAQGKKLTRSPLPIGSDTSLQIPVF